MKIPKDVRVPIFCYKGDTNSIVWVGTVLNDCYYSPRHLNAEVHKFRMFDDGYALSISIYNQLIDYEVTLVRLYEEDECHGLETDLKQWKNASMYDNQIKTSNKIDPQYVISGRDMRSYHLKGGINMEEQIDLEKIGPIQSAGVDLAKYDKSVTTIEKAEITQLPSQFTALIPGTQQHYMQWVLKVSSVSLESIREGEDKIEFRATEVFNLTQNETGKLIGFPTGEGSKLMKFLKDLKIPNPDKFTSIKQIIEAVKGKQCVIKTEQKERDGRTNTYLRFRY